MPTIFFPEGDSFYVTLHEFNTAIRAGTIRWAGQDLVAVIVLNGKERVIGKIPASQGCKMSPKALAKYLWGHYYGVHNANVRS